MQQNAELLANSVGMKDDWERMSEMLQLAADDTGCLENDCCISDAHAALIKRRLYGKAAAQRLVIVLTFHPPIMMVKVVSAYN